MRTLLSEYCYLAGYASIPVSVATYMGKLTTEGMCMDGTCSADTRTLGIFIGLWVPTLLLTGMLVRGDK